MRFVLLFILCALLAGCPAPQPPVMPTASPSPSPSAIPAPTPTPKEVPAAPTPTPAPTTQLDLTGAWTTADGQGQIYDIVIFPNGQAVTTYTKGRDGAQGQRGFWRTDGEQMAIFYDDGSTDVLRRTAEGIRHQRHSAGVALDGAAVSSGEVVALSEPLSKYVGIWQLNKEPDGSYQYVALQSNGRALSTVNGGTEGRWEASENGAKCTWPDGWVDMIERSSQGWQKRSWVGSATDAPADLAPAFRVGETRLTSTPQSIP